MLMSQSTVEPSETTPTSILPLSSAYSWELMKCLVFTATVSSSVYRNAVSPPGPMGFLATRFAGMMHAPVELKAHKNIVSR